MFALHCVSAPEADIPFERRAYTKRLAHGYREAPGWLALSLDQERIMVNNILNRVAAFNAWG